MFRHLWSNVQQMALQFYFIFSVSDHVLNITPQMALRLVESQEVKSKM
jgi:hypothetical protein